MIKSALAVALGLAAYALAQTADSPRGHWIGALQLPNQTLEMVFDLDKTAKGWVGSLAVPAQNATGLPLSQIRLEEGKWKWSIAGGPAFSGKLSTDGQTLDGEFTQSGRAMALKLTHAGEPKVELPQESPAVPKEFTGEWDGTLETPGGNLRLKLKISNEGSTAKATLISLDQGGVEFPVSSIQQKDSTLTIEVKAVNGGYRAEISKDGTQLSGEWTQNANTLPLQLKKAPARATP